MLVGYEKSVCQWITNQLINGKLDKYDTQVNLIRNDRYLSREDYLKTEWKYLYCKALKLTGNDHVVSNFCENFRDSPEDFTLYVVYYLEPMFSSMRNREQLRQGKNSYPDNTLSIVHGKEIEINGEQYVYTGEVDKDGNACGKGVASQLNYSEQFKG